MNDCAPPALMVENLIKYYTTPAIPAVDGLTLNIEQGEIFGLLGPNGAGKTTTISILSTILQPSGGAITICGINALASPMQVRGLIGLVPQEIALYPGLTAWENLAFFGRLLGLTGSRLDSGIAEALRLVGLEEKAHQRVATFSGGMKRRANLAAGMLHLPKVLFLDEPTVGIDAQSRQLILERLKQIQKTGVTMIYTTHYMEEAERLCDRVAIMDRGQVLVQGTPAELIARNPQINNLDELFMALTGRCLRD